MKTVKKILSWMLAAAMLLSVLPGQWVFADTEPILTVGSAKVDVSNGEQTCMVPVSIKNNPGFCTITIDVNKPEGWSLTTTGSNNRSLFIQDKKDATKYSVMCSVEDDEAENDVGATVSLNNNPATITVARQDNFCTADGPLLFLTYSVPADAGNGDHEISITCRQLARYDSSAEDGKVSYNPKIEKGTITVSGGVTALTTENTTVQLSGAPYSYTGEAIEPAFTVTCGGTKLNAGSDYTYQFKDNTDPGTAKLTITGTGKYSGTLTEEFTIAQAKGEITAPKKSFEITYGSDAQQSINASINSGATLIYESENPNVATVTADGVIRPVSAGSTTITISAPAMTYYTKPDDVKVAVTVSKAAQTDIDTSAITVTYGAVSQDLSSRTANAKGTVTYTSSDPAVVGINGTVAAFNNAGTATITVNAAGIEGQYESETWEIPVTVNPKSVTVSGITASDKIYDGTNTATVDVSAAGIAGLESRDSEKVRLSATGTFEDAGAENGKTVDLKVELIGQSAGNYVLSDSSQKTANASISKATVAVPTAKTGLVYNKSSQTGVASLSGTAGYAVTGGTATNADDYTATVTLNDPDNYRWATDFNGEVPWSIAKASAVSLTETRNYRYNDTTSEITFDLYSVKKQLKDGGVITCGPFGSDDNFANLLRYDMGSANYKLVDGLTAGDVGKETVVTLPFHSTNYEDSKLAITIRIVDKTDVSSAITFENSETTYTGQAKTLGTARYNNSGNGFTYAYKDAAGRKVDAPVNAGTYTVTATYQDSENFGTKEATLTIKPAEISVTSAAVSEKTYDGSADAEITTVQFSGLVEGESLTMGTDYTVFDAKFENKNAGKSKTVSYSVQLKNTDIASNYVLTGEIPTAAGTINPKPLTVTAEVTDTGLTFAGNEIKPNVSLVYSAADLVSGDGALTESDYTISYSNNINAGEATATIRSAEGCNYSFNAGTNFTIGKAAAPQLTLTPAEFTMKCTAEGTVTATISGVPMNAGDDSLILPGSELWEGAVAMVTSLTSKAPGKVSVELKKWETVGDSVIIPVYVEMENYEDARLNIKITRTDRDTPTVTVKNITKTYDGEVLTDSEIRGTAIFGTKTISGSWNWVTNPDTMVDADTYKATVRFTPDDIVTYTPVDAELTVKVEQAAIVAPTADRDAKYLSDIFSADDFVDENGKSVPGTLTWYDEDGVKCSGDEEIDTNETYTWEFVPTDRKNYGSGISGTYQPTNYKTLLAAAVIGAISGADSSSFDDVASGDWYADAVSYVTREGLFEGVSEDRFDPNGSMTRAMLVTVLWRMEGSPRIYSYADFKDVPHDTWYSQAVAWAGKCGIVKGISDTEFAPDASITREQLAALLYRYADYKGVDTGASASLAAFADGGKVSSYAEIPMQWAVTYGLLQGMSGNTLAPQGTATRAQVATMLMRFSQWFDL